MCNVVWLSSQRNPMSHSLCKGAYCSMCNLCMQPQELFLQFCSSDERVSITGSHVVLCNAGQRL